MDCFSLCALIKEVKKKIENLESEKVRLTKELARLQGRRKEKLKKAIKESVKS
jgi:uncharacterized protein Veg